ncbi:MAG: hypothetical protein PHF46_05180 [Candidatus Gracilibacteria bacterium]|nr:hypothetical protein [Candidatus Gracilibacteria bacterium]
MNEAFDFKANLKAKLTDSGMVEKTQQDKAETIEKETKKEIKSLKDLLKPIFSKDTLKPVLEEFAKKFNISSDPDDVLSFINKDNSKDFLEIYKTIAFTQARSGDNAYLEDYKDTLKSFLSSGMISQVDFMGFQNELKTFEKDLGTYKKIEPKAELQLDNSYEKIDDKIYMSNNEESNTLLEFESLDSTKAKQTISCKKGNFNIQYTVNIGQVDIDSLDKQKTKVISDLDKQIRDLQTEIKSYSDIIDHMKVLQTKGSGNLSIEDKQFILEKGLGFSPKQIEANINKQFQDDVFDAVLQRVQHTIDPLNAQLTEAQQARASKDAEFEEKIKTAEIDNKLSIDSKSIQNNKNKYSEKITSFVDETFGENVDGNVLKQMFIEVNNRRASFGITNEFQFITFINNPENVVPDVSQANLRDEMVMASKLVKDVFIGKNTDCFFDGNNLKTTGSKIDKDQFEKFIKANSDDYPGLKDLPYTDKMSKTIINEILKITHHTPLRSFFKTKITKNSPQNLTILKYTYNSK